MIYRRSRSEENEHWAPVSDLMAGLMLVFMFVAVIFIRSVVGDAADCDRLYRELRTEFQTDFEEWDVELREDLTIRFRNPDVLFDQAGVVISEPFKNILRDFFPRYVRTLQALENPDDADTLIREIRVEGHTSSEHLAEGFVGKYLGNLKFSQQRAEAVVEFVLELPEAGRREAVLPDGYAVWATERIAAIGLSSSRLRMVDNKQDKAQSRRVEFRAIAAACERASVSEREYWGE